MPGIAGIIWKKPRHNSAAVLDAMLKCMVHEQFYKSGTQSPPVLGADVGWSCLGGSFSDCLPVWNETKDVCLVFSGEGFAEPSDLVELAAKRHSFNPENASALVHLYEDKGLGFLDKLNGWFSGLLLDLRLKKAVLFNDRYGLNRIYYHENETGFYFSSEAKSLLTVLPELRSFDPEGLAEVLSCGCALQNRTLFRGISLLPGGSAWEFAPGQSPRKEVYFNRRVWEEQEPLGGPEFCGKLGETFPRVLQKYLGGKNQIGMSLTGGLDGRMIMAWANRPAESLPCYTFGGIYRDCTDVTLARRVASACQQPHQVIPVDGEFLRDFPALAEKAIYVSDGAMDVTGAVELYVNRIARGIAPVRLTGNYGSEIVRGNVAFKPSRPENGLFDPGLERQIESAAQVYEAEARCHPLSFIAFKQVPWHHYSRLSIELSQLSLRSPYLDNELVALIYRAPAELAVSKEPSLRLVVEGNRALGRIPTDRGVVLETSPLLGRARNLYQEFTFRAEYAYDYGMPQWLAKFDHLFARAHLERLFLGRHKFHHFRVWYRDKLSDYVKSVLLDPQSLSRPYLQKRRVEKIVSEHVSGHGNYTSELHHLLKLELIQRQLLERK